VNVRKLVEKLAFEKEKKLQTNFFKR